jgi:cytochrome P450
MREVRKSGGMEQADLLHGSLTGLADGATEPIRLYLSWFFLLMMKHPEVMRKVDKEIKEVIGNDPISMSHKSLMPFTQSAMMEVYRYSSMAPMQFFHATNKDVMLTDKYLLPKGTQVICDMGNLLHDPEYFPNPDVFDASRFLRDGQYVHDEKLVMFGIGKRPCPGRKISEVILFHMIMTLMREFDIHPLKHPDELSDEFELTFLLRKPKNTPVLLGLTARKNDV